MANLRTYPPCPRCGAQKTANNEPTGQKQMNGYANDGEVPLYYVKCLACGKSFIVGMFALPPNASMSGLDEGLRKRLREKARKERGYAERKGEDWKTAGPKRISSDRIKADIRITPGGVNKNLNARLHNYYKRRGIDAESSVISYG